MNGMGMFDEVWCQYLQTQSYSDTSDSFVSLENKFNMKIYLIQLWTCLPNNMRSLYNEFAVLGSDH